MADEIHRGNLGRACRLVIGDVLAGAGGGPESDLAQATEMALAAETSAIWFSICFGSGVSPRLIVSITSCLSSSGVLFAASL